MKIGIFTPTVLPVINGISTSVDNLKQQLIERGHEVFIITNNYDGIRNDFNDDHFLKVASFPIYYQSLRTPLLINRELYSKIKDLDLDIIHGNSDFGLGVLSRVISYKLNIPHVHTYHCNYDGYADENFPKLIAKLTRIPVALYSNYLCSTSDAVIVPSEYMKYILQNKYHIHKELTMIPSGVNIKNLKIINQDKIEKIKKSYCLCEDDFVILCLSRISKEKRIDEIIDVMNDLKYLENLKLMIVGDGPHLSFLKNKVKEQNLDNIIFTGECPQQEVGNYYELADVFVTNSIAETQGLTVIESLTVGTPVVHINHPLYSFIIDEKTGFSFDNSSELKKILKKLYAQREILIHMKNDLAEVANVYSMENTITQIEKLYQKQIQQKF